MLPIDCLSHTIIIFRISMNTNLQNTVMTKIVIGYLVNAELNLKLSHSRLWMEKKLDPSHSKFQEIQHHGKLYIGILLDHESTTLPEIRDLAKELKSFLVDCNPDIELDVEKVYVFSQTLVV